MIAAVAADSTKNVAKIVEEAPEGADVDAAQASMNDGVLEIRIPTLDHARGRRLEIGEREKAPIHKSA